MAKLKSFRELRVYQKLKALHLEVHSESLTFPKFELYELGSQVRRSSNSLSEWRGTTRTGTIVQEESASYNTILSHQEWETAVEITRRTMEAF